MRVIQHELHEGGKVLLCPVIVCDACGEPIVGEDAGLIVWPEARTFGERRFVHKGRCDPPGFAASEELGEFLEQLLHNYRNPLPGLTPGDRP
jgi:hypothetical protein